ncbi:hypothetical protein [Arthrobacter sp. FW306-2-2C-D06B]|uniref:hypothetical protein n=1 Tax=Arthrobacter sp. FW306-2-2C-D06B TaxID=2879618 RepID=UPI001F1C4DFF|nr:hypothetical protein [Arthrobacter sp. FW306-2-2C-D06B]UKA60644.1 hypothetical protein LFT47_10080 [Arthrobacter sp. FW306-2-2C-D06B]
MSALLPELIPDSTKICRTEALPASGAASLLHGVTIVLHEDTMLALPYGALLG